MKNLTNAFGQYKTALLLLMISFLLTFLPGCFQYYYRVSNPPSIESKDLAKMRDQNKLFVIHSGSTICLLENPYLDKYRLRGWMTDVPANLYNELLTVPKKHRYLKNSQIDHSAVANVAHFWVDEPVTWPDSLNLAVRHITKIEITDKDKGATILAWAGPPVVVGLAAVLIASSGSGSDPEPAPTPGTGSCPFVFSFNGEQFTFEGEAYSGSITPGAERTDYLPIYGLKPVDGKYYLYLNNQNREIQHTNLAQLVIAECPLNTGVVIDKYGTPQLKTSAQPMLSATDSKGTEHRAELTDADGQVYFATPDKELKNLTDELTVTFTAPERVGEAKLFIRARNSILLDYGWLKYTQLFGDNYERWYRIVSKQPSSSIEQWKQEQGIPLAVWIQENGQWKYVDSYNPPGYMAFRPDVLSVPIARTNAGATVKIKLVSGKAFWEIDQVSLDCTPDSPIAITVVPPSSATDQNGQNVLNLLLNDDQQYLVQPTIGDDTELTFDVPKEQPGCTRFIFLQTKGHYKILGSNTDGRSLVYMYRFNRPGRFTRFVQQNYFSLLSAD